VNIDVDIPANPGRLRLMMCTVPFPVVVVVAMVVLAFVAAIAACQGKCNSAQKENEAQHVFDCVLHKEWFLSILFLKSCQAQNAGKQGVII
jgi:hypothetical protein